MTNTARKPPLLLANARVLEYAVLDDSVRYSGRSFLFVDGKELGPVPCLAICRESNNSGGLLLHCDWDWSVLGVAGYPSSDEAKRRAEHIYPGVSTRWIKPEGAENGPTNASEIEIDLRC